jgi:hypothetical protein
VNSPTIHRNWSLFNFSRSFVLLAEDPDISLFACLTPVNPTVVKVSLLLSVQTGSGAHSASYTVCKGAFSPGAKLPEHITHVHLVPRLRMRGPIPSLSICFHGVVFNKVEG